MSKQVTSIYLFPMWCLCLCRAKSLCSSLTKRTSASPFLLPWALRHSAAPPLYNTTYGKPHVNRGLESVTSYMVTTDEWLQRDTFTVWHIYNILGNVEASEETSNVLVRRLPWQPSGSDHCIVAHFLPLTTACTHTNPHNPTQKLAHREWILSWF